MAHMAERCAVTPRKGADALSTSNTSAFPSKILIIEDEILNANFLERYLTSLGYEAIKTFNGEDGLVKTYEYQPDLILLDIMMPGMNGFEVCEHLRNDPKTTHIPILMVTALHDTSECIKALEVGADDFLSKPFNIYELAARVKSLLRIKYQHDELERRNRLLDTVMRRYVSPEVSKQVLTDPERYLQLGGETRQVTTLFCDIRGFTSYAQTHDASRVVELLNLIFKELTDVIFQWRGTLDKYIGDAIMAIYGAPVSYEDDVLRAIRTALDMQTAFHVLRQQWTNEQERGLGLGIGIHTGEAVVGNVGTERLMDYTVIGDAVNIAQRLTEMASRGQILISDSTFQHVKHQARVQSCEACVLRGRKEETTIHLLLNML
jgi:class 3 adenylate cyclase